MQVNLNMKNVGSLFDPVPDDVYRVRVKDLEDKTGDAGPYVKISLMIVEGEFAEKRQISENMGFDDSRLPFAKRILEALTAQKWDEDDMAFDTDELKGLECLVLTKTRAYTNNEGQAATQSVVDKWFPLPDNATAGSI
jgi:hypothetical protein